MKKSLKVLLTSTLLLTMSFGLFGCGNGGQQAQQPADPQKQEAPKQDEPQAQDGVKTVEEGKLLVGMECGYAPFNWTQVDDANGAVAIEGGDYANGYDVQIAKKIAESMGKELVIVKTTWDGLVPAVQSGYIDLIIAGMSATEKRKEEVDFSNNYYTSDLVVITKANSPLLQAQSLEDLAGAKITGQLSTFHYDVIDQIPDVDKLEAMEDFPAMRVALQSGIIDGYVSERPEGIAAKAANPDFDYVEFEQGKGFDFTQDEVSIAVGMKKGNTALLEAVNQALAGVSEADREQLMKDAIDNANAAE